MDLVFLNDDQDRADAERPRGFDERITSKPLWFVLMILNEHAMKDVYLFLFGFTLCYFLCSFAFCVQIMALSVYPPNVSVSEH